MCADTYRIATLRASGTLCLEAVPSLRESRQPEIMAVVISMMVLAFTAVLLRLMSRRVSSAKLGVDDALILLALVR